MPRCSSLSHVAGSHGSRPANTSHVSSVFHLKLPCLRIHPPRPYSPKLPPDSVTAYNACSSSPPKPSSSPSPPGMPTQLIHSPPIPMSPSMPDSISAPLVSRRSLPPWSKRTIVGRMWRVVDAGFATVVTKAVADAVLKNGWVESSCVWIYRRTGTARCESKGCFRCELRGRLGCRRRYLG